MASKTRRITSAQSVKERARAQPASPPERCAVWGCPRHTQRSSGKGFSETYCQGHVEHIRRHGHPSRRSYRAWEIGPYRAAAKAWLLGNEAHPGVKLAVSHLESLLFTQDRAKGPNHQRGMVPRDKARNTLAKLREADKSGRQLLEIIVAVAAAHHELGPHGYPDWVSIQTGKLVKRMRGVGGTFERNHEGRRMTEVYPEASSIWKRSWEKWPRSEGQYIRILGEMLRERVPDSVVDEAVTSIRRAIHPECDE